MREHVLAMSAVTPEDAPRVGGKAWRLAAMSEAGVPVPRGGLGITTDAYRVYLEQTGVGSRIMLELVRKPFADMRWEELFPKNSLVKHTCVAPD